MAMSLHKNVACEACHVKVLGGYEMTSWGPGTIAGKPNPFKKYSLYYGPMEPPILIKDQKGRWIPTKIWPNSTGNIKDPVLPVQELTFRWPDGETHDAYALLGTFDIPHGNNRYLAWLQVEQVAHPLGKSRTCGSCHDSGAQVSKVTWEYLDYQGALPFTGSQKVIADKDGLRVTDIKATSKIVLMENGKSENFAAWMSLGDIWKTSGDFSIPKSDPVKYQKLDKGVRDALVHLEVINKKLKAREAKGEDVKKLRRRWREAKAVAAHEPESAGALMEAVAAVQR